MKKFAALTMIAGLCSTTAVFAQDQGKADSSQTGDQQTTKKKKKKKKKGNDQMNDQKMDQSAPK